VEQDLDISVGDGAAIAVPSGQFVTLLDIIWNSEGPEGPAPRFRFVAPAISRDGGTISYDAAEVDLQHLCEGFALAKLVERGLDAPLVLLAIADRAVEFGVPDPEATQYVDAFRIEGTTCVREIF
jgi:Family of unknown function (DUF6497)